MAAVFDIATFRVSYPEFSNATTYTTQTCTGYWTIATEYIANDDYGRLTNKGLALDLMTAHLLKLNDIMLSGNTAGMVTGSTEDKVSVTLTPPPIKNQFHWWLSLTTYGQQLLALLSAKAVGGWYVGGFAETAAFRR